MGRSFDSHPLVEGYGTSCRGAPELSYCLHNYQKSVSVQGTKPTPNVRGTLGAYIILKTCAQLLGKTEGTPWTKSNNSHSPRRAGRSPHS